jgi:outer membrane protein
VFFKSKKTGLFILHIFISYSKLFLRKLFYFAETFDNQGMENMVLILKKSIFIVLVLTAGAYAQNGAVQNEYAGLNLDRCLNIARARNNLVLKSHQEISKAKGQKIEGYSLAMPSINLTARYTKFDEGSFETFDTGEEDFSFGSTEAVNVAAGLTQKLYSGGKVMAGIKAAKLVDLQAAAMHKAIVRDVELVVKKQFYDLLLARDLVEVNELAVKLFEENLENVQSKFDAGLVSNFEVLRAKVELANIKPNLIESVNNRKLAREKLKKTLNIPLENEISITGSLEFTGYDLDLDNLVRVGMDKRPEIEARENFRDLNRENVTAAKSEQMPRLNFFFNYEGNSRTIGDEDAFDLLYGWNTGLNFNMTVFNGSATRGRVIQAKADHEKAAIDLANLMQQIELEVRAAFYNYEKARQIIQTQKENVAQAEEGVRQAKERADRGLITQFEYRDTQLSLTTARTEYRKGLHDYNVSLFALERAAGIDFTNGGQGPLPY